MSSRADDETQLDAGALLMLAFIALLIIKAIGFDLSWGIVTSPLWSQIAYFVVMEVLGIKPAR